MLDEVFVLKIYTSEIEARMAQQTLRAEGILAFVSKDDAGGMEPHLQRTSGVRLLVKRTDAERASKICGPV